MAFEVEFSKRLDLFGAEIFAALNDKKVALEAQGKKLYNLSVGTPDFEPMPHIKQALCDAAMVSENWKYSLRDLPELLDTVCAYYKRRFDVDGITPDQIMSFNGSQDGMGHMGLALLNDGDVVLLPDPCYPVFITGVKLGRPTRWAAWAARSCTRKSWISAMHIRFCSSMITPTAISSLMVPWVTASSTFPALRPVQSSSSL